ncbi:Oocyte zinc finger protein XlCOF20-like [Homarus americanus]|uniref:Oocyte zinc finger protein XlCOF20-like n=1 Tax=Homarus americanus TaxID=6706 RepID=A0A8J5TIV4_HOMAM|nr:Oocyte zinc finger protein XlCOF20-like [Homarus americanus]
MSITGDVRGVSRRCHVPGCGASSPGVVVYSVRKSKDEEGHRRWMTVLGLADGRLAVHACQRHFPAGAPTRNHPDPNPNLFNPIPNQPTQNGCSSLGSGPNIPPIFNTAADGTPLGPNGQPLPAPVQPPPGSVTKLAPNATLIDLNKIKKDHDGDRPFRIEQVTVLIDEADDVKVVGYGPRDPLNTSPVERIPGRLGRPRKVQPPPPPMWDDGGATDGLEDIATEPSYHQFGDPSVGNALEQMRQLRIDCNTALVDMDKRQMVYAHRAVLVARSPYFYRQMYLRRKKLKYLYQFCRFTLPIDVNFDVVDAVVSYMYTGSMNTLWGKGTASIRKVLNLFEMKEALELYDQEVAGREVEEKEPRRARKRMRREHGEDNLENLVMPLLSETGGHVDGGGEEGFRGEERRRRRKTVDQDGGDDVHGKMKIDPTHISKYVHMIAMYRYRIRMGRKTVGRSDAGSGGTGADSKDTLMPPLLEGDVLPDDSSTPQDLDDLVNRMAGDGEELLSGPGSALTRACFQQVSTDLKRRAVSDLELYVNPSFHEELIMHIMVDQVEDRGILPLSLAVFLAKGCNFCRKKECKGEDLTLPISPDNPVCPDRQCIKRNLICEMCNKQMSNSKSLARHKYSLHDIQVGDTGGLFICSHCGETFSKKWKLNMHERQHEDRKLEVACLICGKVMRGAMALKKHVSMVHETRPQFQCDFCSKSFKRKETLNVHLRIHTGEKPFPCPRCEYASETKGNLKAHMWRKHKIQLGGPSAEQQAAEEQAMAATLISYSRCLHVTHL